MCRISLTLAALALAAPAAAQDGSEPGGARTVESAQRFLAENFGGERVPVMMSLKLIGAEYQMGFSGMKTGEGFFGSGETQSWVVTERCKSILTVTNIRPIYDDPAQQRVQYDAPPQVMRIEFDWSRVTRTGASDTPYSAKIRTSVELPIERSVYGVGAYYDSSEPMLPVFYFSNLEKAKRVAFAMEYLKDNCAKKSDTGF